VAVLEHQVAVLALLVKLILVVAVEDYVQTKALT
jgi:hypothetical protein